jgi:DNA modification methylase
MMRLLTGDCRAILPTLPVASVHCVVTSPPYWGLRSYGIGTENGEIGLETSFTDYIETLRGVFREVRRVLRADGTLWLNMGDTYAAAQNGRSARDAKLHDPANRTFRDKPFSTIDRTIGLKPKDLVGMPWRVAFALQTDGWYLRSDIIWSKPNPMPESVSDRPTKAHEYVFLMSKSERYFYDQDAIRDEPSGRTDPIRSFGNNPNRDDSNDAGWALDGFVGRNKRTVWEIPTSPFPEAHFATFPPALIEPCILAGCPRDGTVLDPFGGAGTTGLVADRLGRNAVLIELSPVYAAMAESRITNDAPLLAQVTLEHQTAKAVS